ncbi:hypothetical protein SAMN05216482_9202 [Streptomyces sp. PAN_FS17]|nr:hypothetical protein SAMN05216482_9202 [Streptomyces sp. PAN_FS17]
MVAAFCCPARFLRRRMSLRLGGAGAGGLAGTDALKDCGQKFTDERWEAIGYTRDWSKYQSHPHLCEDCQRRAVTAQA